MNVNTVHTIFGAGAVGTELARQLVAKGVTVRLVSRRGTKVEGAETIIADLYDQRQAIEAAKGSAVVYNCSNAPYDKWTTELKPLFDSILNAAIAAKADYILFSNLYSYGPQSKPMTEKTPESAIGSKALIRKALDDEAMRAHKDGKVRVAILRAADYYGPNVENAHLAERVWKPLFDRKTVDWIGSPDAKHAMAYIPDVARALAQVGIEQRGFGQKWILPHAPAISPKQMMEIAVEGLDIPLKVRGVNKTMLGILGLFMPLMKELKETFYQFESDYLVDSSAFEKEFGWQATPIREGIIATVKDHRKQPLITR